MLETEHPDKLPRTGQRAWASLWSAGAAFGAYFCMYAFRKPFTAGTYRNEAVLGMDFKTLLVTAQVLGYTLSKFLGIKFISEVRPDRRAPLLLTLIALAEASLLLFALTPAPWNLIWLFLNGAPLGMVFGLVLGFLEGRRNTEAMAAGLCTSFIVSDGVVKSVGAVLLQKGVSEYWMPFLTGLLFVPPLLLFTWMLTRIPQPSIEDVQARSPRLPMSKQDRSGFFRRYALGLTLLVTVYTVITILRSVRADFAPEIWKGLLGATAPPSVFAASETVVGLVVLALFGSVAFVRHNHKAFRAGLGLALGGAVVVGLTPIGLHLGVVPPFTFMILLGIGLYLPYFAVHTILFERLIAMTRDRGNIGYLMYLADSSGYFGYVLILLARNALGKPPNFLTLFNLLSWITAASSVVLLAFGWIYFAKHPATQARQRLESTGVLTSEAGGVD